MTNNELLKFYFHPNRDYFVKLYMLHGMNPLPKAAIKSRDQVILMGEVIKLNADNSISFTNNFVKIFIDEWEKS